MRQKLKVASLRTIKNRSERIAELEAKLSKERERADAEVLAGRAEAYHKGKIWALNWARKNCHTSDLGMIEAKIAGLKSAAIGEAREGGAG